MRVEDVPEEAREDLIDELGDLRHDLGKYIGFETRMVGDEEAELRAALERDLLRTRDHRGQPESCWAIWARLRPGTLHDDPDVAAIDDLLEQLSRAVEKDLSSFEQTPLGNLKRARDLASQVTEATRRLHARALALREIA
jgi:hypothetical protein